MNYELMESVIKHIMANLAIIPSKFIDLENTRSLRSKDLILEDKLKINSENDIFIKDIWGCQFLINNVDMKILLTDCSLDENLIEYCVIVSLKDAPSYGMYLCINTDDNHEYDSQPLLAVSVSDNNWIECSSYLQGTFLAGMEQIKDLGVSWKKCSDYSQEYEMLLSFIDYHESFYEVKNEG